MCRPSRATSRSVGPPSNPIGSFIAGEVPRRRLSAMTTPSMPRALCRSLVEPQPRGAAASWSRSLVEQQPRGAAGSWPLRHGPGRAGRSRFAEKSTVGGDVGNGLEPDYSVVRGPSVAQQIGDAIWHRCGSTIPAELRPVLSGSCPFPLSKRASVQGPMDGSPDPRPGPVISRRAREHPDCLGGLHQPADGQARPLAPIPDSLATWRLSDAGSYERRLLQGLCHSRERWRLPVAL